MDNGADFTTGSIPKKMISFMFPILLALVLQSMYSAVDLIIVGHYGTKEGMSAVSTGASIMHLFTIVIMSLSTGVTVLMGKYIGEKMPEKIGKLLGRAVFFFAIVSVLLSVLLIFFAKPISVLMQAPTEALDLTAEYISICGGGFVFVVFYNFLSCIFRGMGNSRLPLLFVLIACITNIFGDLIFVAVLEMDVAGAAIATVVSQALSVIISIVVIKKQKFPFKMERSYVKAGREITDFLKIGAPLAFQDILTNVTFLAICAFVNQISLDASSGYGVAQRIVGFIMLIPSSIMQSMASFVAQNVGAGEEDRAKRCMKFGMLFGVTIGVFVTFSIFFYGDSVSSLFTSESGVIACSFEYLKGFAPEAIITCILFSFYGYFNGHSKSLFVMVQGLIQSFLIRLPISYFMSRGESASLMGMGFAPPSATAVGIIICLIYYMYFVKSLKKTEVALS